MATRVYKLFSILGVFIKNSTWSFLLLCFFVFVFVLDFVVVVPVISRYCYVRLRVKLNQHYRNVLMRAINTDHYFFRHYCFLRVKTKTALFEGSGPKIKFRQFLT